MRMVGSCVYSKKPFFFFFFFFFFFSTYGTGPVIISFYPPRSAPPNHRIVRPARPRPLNSPPAPPRALD